MIRLIFTIPTLFFAVSSLNNYHLLSYRKNAEVLSDCFKNNANLKQAFPQLTLRTKISDFMGFHFTEKSKTIEHILFIMKALINNMTENHVIDVDSSSEAFSQLMEAAAIDCSDNGVENSSTGSSGDIAHQDLPDFIDEPFRISILLDYILVNWPYSLEKMVSFPDTRTLLWRFATEALVIIECAYSRLFRDSFQKKLRLYWLNRAELFFDGSDDVHPYINHSFAENYLGPIASGDLSIFPSRGAQDFSLRNPRASNSDLKEICQLHVSDPDDDGDDFIENYVLYGFTKADYYFEYHRHEFYRLLFFFLELEAYGISIDDKNAAMPERLMAILYNRPAYINFLRETRSAMMFGPNNIYRQHLIENNRIFEEDLLMLLKIRNNDFALMRTTTTTTSTTKSTTQKYEDSSRGKTKFWKGLKKKCFWKQERTNNLDNSGSSSGTGSNSQQQNQQTNNVIDQLLLGSEEALFLLRTASVYESIKYDL